MRTVSFCVRHNPTPCVLVECIEEAIGNNGIGTTIFVGHGLRRRRESNLRQNWFDELKPLEMVLTLVDLVVAIAELVLVEKALSEADEPAVIVHRCTNPNRTRVIPMRRLVSSVGGNVNVRRAGRNGLNPVSRIQQLAAFKDHFHNMLVTVPAGTATRIGVKEEDVHLLRWRCRCGNTLPLRRRGRRVRFLLKLYLCGCTIQAPVYHIHLELQKIAARHVLF